MRNVKSMDLEAFLVNHAVLALDTVDINDADDFELVRKESKQWFGRALSGNDISTACICTCMLIYTECKNLCEDVSLHGKPLIRSFRMNYDINQL